MTGFVLFGGILALLATAIIWAALRASDDAEGALAPAERRDAAIEALRQLEFEYGTGKVSDEEYFAVRDRLRAEALEARDAAGGPACPGCGSPLERGERFCPACGREVEGSPT